MDEAQAWLLAASFATPLEALVPPGEGHPPLWFWGLRILSLGLDFNQARLFSLLVAFANAILLFHLLRGHVLLLGSVLFSLIVTQYWGYHFRPYGVVLLCLLSALLLERKGQTTAATWIMAAACGFHFFAGFLFALWLGWQWRKGARLSLLTPPALLALAFGALAILSGMGNPEAGPMVPDLLAGALHNLSWFMPPPPLRHPLMALASFALLAFALRDRPYMLALLSALLLLFAAATAAVYGRYPWHSAFMVMMCLAAFALVGMNRTRSTVLAVLLMPQLLFGAAEAYIRLRSPHWVETDLLMAAQSDAGADFTPEQDLVAWPDFAGLALAATHGVQIVSGYDGSLLGPVRWRDRDPETSMTTLTRHQRPYWLVCQRCDQIVPQLENAGLRPTMLAERASQDEEPAKLYRID